MNSEEILMQVQTLAVGQLRMSIRSKGKGKSGGARVITYLLSVIEENVDITLLTIYDKSERESISDNEIKALIQTLEKE